MDDVDNRFAAGSAPGPDRDRVRIRIIAELQEAAVGRLTRQKLVSDIQSIARSRSSDDLRTIFADLHDYYILKAPRESYLPLDMRMKMGGELLASGSMLPNDLRKLSDTAAVLDHVQTSIRNHQIKGTN
jgi:hypothetical protein